MKDKDYIEEKDLKRYSKSMSLEEKEIAFKQMKYSICKIICNVGHGTGFFCKIPNLEEWDTFKRVLMTNNHKKRYITR